MLLGVLVLLLRELSDGTSELPSLSSSSLEESSSDSSSCWAARRWASCSTALALNFSCAMARVSCGFLGCGDFICEGESERPLGTPVLEWRLWPEEVLVGGPGFVAPLAGGMSMMFSLRPEVGSTTESRAGSWDTWWPSMMYCRFGQSRIPEGCAWTDGSLT